MADNINNRDRYNNTVKSTQLSQEWHKTDYQIHPFKVARQYNDVGLMMIEGYYLLKQWNDSFSSMGTQALIWHNNNSWGERLCFVLALLCASTVRGCTVVAQWLSKQNNVFLWPVGLSICWEVDELYYDIETGCEHLSGIRHLQRYVASQILHF